MDGWMEGGREGGREGGSQRERDSRRHEWRRRVLSFLLSMLTKEEEDVSQKKVRGLFMEFGQLVHKIGTPPCASLRCARLSGWLSLSLSRSLALYALRKFARSCVKILCLCLMRNGVPSDHIGA